MSGTIIVAGVKPWDGRYELEFEREFTTREWGWIKRLAGYLPMAVTDEVFGDPELVCVLAVIAMHRSGRVQSSEVPAMFDRLVDAPFGSAITFEAGDQDEDVTPDPSPPNANANGNISGGDSTASSENSTELPSSIGTLASDSSVSDPSISAT